MYGLVRTVSKGISRNAERNSELVRNANKIRTGLKDIRQTVAQAEKVEKFVKSQKKDELVAKIERTANYNKEFKAFINDFNEKHKTKITVLDVSNYAKEYKNLSKPGLKAEDLKLLEEFRKRRLEIKARQTMVTLQDDETLDSELQQDIRRNDNSSDGQSKHRNMNTSEDQEGFEGKEGGAGEDRNISNLRDKLRDDGDADNEQDVGQAALIQSMNAEPSSRGGKIFHKPRQGPIEIDDTFYACVLAQDTTTLVTTLNRINSFRCLVFMANAGGVVAYGRGKGADSAQAMQKAWMNCNNNMIALSIDPHLAVPERLNERFLDYELVINPRKIFNPWGNPAAAAIISLCGLSHCNFKTIHTDSNNYGLLNVIFKAVTKNKTPQFISEREGFKIYRHQWIKPLERAQGRSSIRN